MSSGEHQLGRKVAVGTIWSIAGRFIVKSLGFISILILARILAPDDFGVIAATMIMVGLLEILFNFSFDINIIQKKEVTSTTLNSAWTCKLLSGLVLTLLLFFGSHAIALYFADPRLVQVVQAIALLPLLKSAKNIGFVLYRKELDLKSEFKLDAYAKAVSFVVTVSLALWMQSYWALLLGIYSNVVAKLVLSFWMHPYRPWFCLREARELFSFSKWLLLRNVTVYFNTNAPALMIGRLSTPEQLGFYSISYEVSNLPTTELLYPLSRAAYPGYVKLNEKPAELSRFFLRMSRLIVLVVAPVSFGLAAVSEQLVAVLLGSQWMSAAPLLGLLAIYGFVRAGSQNVESIFVALGRPRLCFFIMFVLTLGYIPCLYLAFQFAGLQGIAYVMIANAIVYSVVSYSFLAHLLQFKLTSVLHVYALPLGAAILMFFGVRVLGDYTAAFVEPLWLLLLLKVMIGAFIYLAILLLQHVVAPAGSLFSEAWTLVRQLKKR